MGNQIKLQNIDMSKVGYTAGKVVKDAANFVRNHKEKLLGGSLLLALADGIRLRVCTRLKSTHCGQRQNGLVRPTGVLTNLSKS